MDLELHLWVNVTKLDFLLTKDVVTSAVVICMICNFGSKWQVKYARQTATGKTCSPTPRHN